MILADRFYEWLERGASGYLNPNQCAAAMFVLGEAHKYVFPQNTTKIAEDAVRAPDKIARFLSFPATYTWMEFVDENMVRGGLLVNCHADPDLRSGLAIFVSQMGTDIAFGSEKVDLSRGVFSNLLITGKPSHYQFLRRILGAITLLGAPDLLEKRPVNLDKLNRARGKKNKPALYNHEIIDLHLTQQERDLERQAESYRGPGGESGIRMRHHFVRAHIRIYEETGHVTKVKPHWRGDPTLGEAPRKYLVRP